MFQNNLLIKRCLFHISPQVIIYSMLATCLHNYCLVDPLFSFRKLRYNQKQAACPITYFPLPLFFTGHCNSSRAAWWCILEIRTASGIFGWPKNAAHKFNNDNRSVEPGPCVGQCVLGRRWYRGNQFSFFIWFLWIVCPVILKLKN